MTYIQPKIIKCALPKSWEDELSPEENTLMYMTQAVHDMEYEETGEPNNCIAASGVLQCVLRIMGIDAHCVRTSVTAFWGRSHAVSLGRPGSSKSSPDGWAGHLTVIAHGKYLIDPTIDQADVDINIGILTVPPKFLKGNTIMQCRDGDGHQLSYQIYPGKGGWQTAPDYRKGVREEGVRSVFNRLATQYFALPRSVIDD